MTRHYNAYQFIFLLFLLGGSISLSGESYTGYSYTLQSDESGGSKSYLAKDSIRLKRGFHYKASPGNSFNAKVDASILVPPTGGIYMKPDGTLTDDPSQGGVVGSIPGQFAVSPTGAATYAIPVECPPGINGMQPNISLVYNSQAGNGIAGWGWNLGGVSAISRTGSNLYNDGVKAAVSLNNSDNLMFDGQRLVLVGGTHLVNGAKYRTEMESYNDITIKSMGGKLYFEVRTKGGITIQYGYTADSYIEAQNSTIPLTWAISKAFDNNGNYMSYTYGENNSTGEFWLSKIEYTGNTAAGVSPMNEIEFLYTASRIDPQTTYVAGRKISQTRLLHAIKIKTNSNVQKEYSFSYANDEFYSKLISINLKGQDGVRYNPTTVNWEKDESNDYYSTSTTMDKFIDDLRESVVMADFGNDGYADVLRLKYASYIPTGGSPQGGDACVGWEYYRTVDKGTNLELIQSENYESMSGYNHKKYYYPMYKLIPVDINYDGMIDLVEIKGNLETGWNNTEIILDVLLNIQGEFVRQNLDFLYSLADLTDITYDRYLDHFEIMDYNGDGRVELLARKSGTDRSHQSKTEFYLFDIDIDSDSLSLLTYKKGIDWTIAQHSISDVNGNGIPEIYYAFGTNATYLEYNPETDLFENIGSSFNLINHNHEPIFADFNGDGYTDVFAHNIITRKWELYFSTGAGFVDDVACPITRQRSMVSNYSESYSDYYYVSDFNGDGKADILEAYGSVLNVYYYNGDSFILETYPDYNPTKIYYNPSAPYYDVRGLGKSDIIGVSNVANTRSSLSIISLNTSESKRQVSAITNGLRQKKKIRYLPLSDSSVYNLGGSQVTYPVMKTSVPMSVVSEVNTVVENLSDTTSYQYVGLRLHAKGKGFLGFEEFTEKSTAQKRISKLQMEFNSKYFNAFPKIQTVTNLNNQNVSTTTYVNSVMSLGLDKDRRFFHYVSSQTSRDNLTGLTTVVQTSDYDDYGNPGTMTVTKGSALSSRIIETSTGTYVRAGSWCPNKLSAATSTKSVNGQSSTRTSQYAYDSKGNIISIISDPYDVNSVKTTYQNYDNFGHCRLVTKTTNGISRSTSSTYTLSGRFLLSKTNSLGETTTYDWDENKSALKSETDRKGTTHYTYNGLGKLEETCYPDNTRKIELNRWAVPDNELGALYYTYTEISGTAPVLTWYNKAGQEILRETYGLNNKKILISTEYYQDGSVYRVSNPYFTQDASLKTWAETYVYDGYGRISSLATPMGTTTTVYNGRVTTVTGPDGTNQTTVNDAGQIISSKMNGKTVSYDYYPSGLVKATAPEGGQSVVMEYDLQGNRTKLTDPDAGIIESKYNGFGELVQTRQKVHNNNDYVTTSYNYSANGLLQNVLRNGKETENKVFFYDNRNRISSIAIINRHRQTFTYDDFDRITNVKEEIDGRTYNRSTEYDRFGRIKKEIYPSGYYTVNAYDDYGNLVEARDKSDNLIWKAGRENARRQLISLQRGNMTSSFEYSQDVLPYKQYTAGVSNMIYAFNNQINMRYRHDMISDQDQELGYDSLNRLVSWDAYSYDSLYSLQEYSVAYHSATGNIKSKTNAGTDFLYGEHDGKPHALSSFQPDSGTVVPAADLNITYTDFKKAATLSEGDKFYEIIYGVDEQRRKSVYQEDSVVRLTRYYMGDYEEEIDSDGNVRKIHYLNGGAVLIQNHGQDSLLFAHTDYLGSLLALSDANGNVLERYAYDPWGKRVNPANWTESDARTSFILNRGYTGHEHLDMFGLINMNGRVYDPLTSQFLSPDPYIQSPDRWLNFNRYSYAFNNPLSYTDPSGEFVFGYATGFFRGLFSGKNPLKEGWKGGVNELKIWGGLFASDSNKNFGGRLLEVVSRFTWQLPQTILGLSFSNISNYAGQVDNVDYWGGATVLSGNNWGSGGAVTLGSYISGGRSLKADPNTALFQHEYGHYLQSQKMGWGYIPRVGIPSLMSAAKKDGNHKYQPFEQDANRRAFNYFNKNVDGFYKSFDDRFDNRGWNFYSNPLDVYHVGKKSRGVYYDYNNSADMALVNSLALHANFWDYAGWLFMPFAPVGSLFWFTSNSLMNTFWYNSTRVTD